MNLQPLSESSGLQTTFEGSIEGSCRQIDLADSLRLTKRQKLDRDLCKAVLYQGNCSHGMLTENRHWKAVIQGLANDAGLQGYVPPSRYKLSKELLDYHYAELRRLVGSLACVLSTTQPSLHPSAHNNAHSKRKPLSFLRYLLCSYVMVLG